MGGGKVVGGAGEEEERRGRERGWRERGAEEEGGRERWESDGRESLASEITKKEGILLTERVIQKIVCCFVRMCARKFLFYPIENLF